MQIKQFPRLQTKQFNRFPTYYIPQLVVRTFSEHAEKQRENYMIRMQQQARARTLIDPLLNKMARDKYRQVYEQTAITELAGRLVGAGSGALLGYTLGGLIGGAVGSLIPVAGTAAGTSLGSKIGASIGGAFGVLHGDYTSYHAAVELVNDTIFETFRNPGMGLMNSLYSLGYTMDQITGANIIKSGISAAISGEDYWEKLGATYGLGEEGRIEMDFSSIREQLGLDLNGFGNFVFDFAGEMLTDPGALSGIGKKASITSAKKGVAQTLKESNEEMSKMIVKKTSELAKAGNKKVLKSFTNGIEKAILENDWSKLKRLLDGHNIPFSAEGTQAYIKTLHAQTAQKTSVKIFNTLKGFNDFDNAVSSALFKYTTSPGLVFQGGKALKWLDKHTIGLLNNFKIRNFFSNSRKYIDSKEAEMARKIRGITLLEEGKAAKTMSEQRLYESYRVLKERAKDSVEFKTMKSDHKAKLKEYMRLSKEGTSEEVEKVLEEVVLLETVLLEKTHAKQLNILKESIRKIKKAWYSATIVGEVRPRYSLTVTKAINDIFNVASTVGPGEDIFKYITSLAYEDPKLLKWVKETVDQELIKILKEEFGEYGTLISGVKDVASLTAQEVQDLRKADAVAFLFNMLTDDPTFHFPRLEHSNKIENIFKEAGAKIFSKEVAEGMGSTYHDLFTAIGEEFDDALKTLRITNKNVGIDNLTVEEIIQTVLEQRITDLRFLSEFKTHTVQTSRQYSVLRSIKNLGVRLSIIGKDGKLRLSQSTDFHAFLRNLEENNINFEKIANMSPKELKKYVKKNLNLFINKQDKEDIINQLENFLENNSKFKDKKFYKERRELLDQLKKTKITNEEKSLYGAFPEHVFFNRTNTMEHMVNNISNFIEHVGRNYNPNYVGYQAHAAYLLSIINSGGIINKAERAEMSELLNLILDELKNESPDFSKKIKIGEHTTVSKRSHYISTEKEKLRKGIRTARNEVKKELVKQEDILTKQITKLEDLIDRLQIRYDDDIHLIDKLEKFGGAAQEQADIIDKNLKHLLDRPVNEMLKEIDDHKFSLALIEEGRYTNDTIDSIHASIKKSEDKIKRFETEEKVLEDSSLLNILDYTTTKLRQSHNARAYQELIKSGSIDRLTSPIEMFIKEIDNAITNVIKNAGYGDAPIGSLEKQLSDLSNTTRKQILTSQLEREEIGNQIARIEDTGIEESQKMLKNRINSLEEQKTSNYIEYKKRSELTNAQNQKQMILKNRKETSRTKKLIKEIEEDLQKLETTPEESRKLLWQRAFKEKTSELEKNKNKLKALSDQKDTLGDVKELSKEISSLEDDLKKIKEGTYVVDFSEINKQIQESKDKLKKYEPVQKELDILREKAKEADKRLLSEDIIESKKEKLQKTIKDVRALEDAKKELQRKYIKATDRVDEFKKRVAHQHNISIEQVTQSMIDDYFLGMMLDTWEGMTITELSEGFKRALENRDKKDTFSKMIKNIDKTESTSEIGMFRELEDVIPQDLYRMIRTLTALSDETNVVNQRIIRELHNTVQKLFDPTFSFKTLDEIQEVLNDFHSFMEKQLDVYTRYNIVRAHENRIIDLFGANILEIDINGNFVISGSDLEELLKGRDAHLDMAKQLQKDFTDLPTYGFSSKMSAFEKPLPKEINISLLTWEESNIQKVIDIFENNPQTISKFHAQHTTKNSGLIKRQRSHIDGATDDINVPINQRTRVYFDIESSNLEFGTGIQFSGWIVRPGQEIPEQFDIYIDPTDETFIINESASKASHGLTMEDLKNFKKEGKKKVIARDNILKELKATINDENAIIIGHNIGYDMKVLASTFDPRIIESQVNKITDPVKKKKVIEAIKNGVSNEDALALFNELDIEELDGFFTENFDYTFVDMMEVVQTSAVPMKLDMSIFAQTNIAAAVKTRQAGIINILEDGSKIGYLYGKPVLVDDNFLDMYPYFIVQDASGGGAPVTNLFSRNETSLELVGSLHDALTDTKLTMETGETVFKNPMMKNMTVSKLHDQGNIVTKDTFVEQFLDTTSDVANEKIYQTDTKLRHVREDLKKVDEQLTSLKKAKATKAESKLKTLEIKKERLQQKEETLIKLRDKLAKEGSDKVTVRKLLEDNLEKLSKYYDEIHKKRGPITDPLDNLVVKIVEDNGTEYLVGDGLLVRNALEDILEITDYKSVNQLSMIDVEDILEELEKLLRYTGPTEQIYGTGIEIQHILERMKYEYEYVLHSIYPDPMRQQLNKMYVKTIVMDSLRNNQAFNNFYYAIVNPEGLKTSTEDLPEIYQLIKALFSKEKIRSTKGYTQLADIFSDLHESGMFFDGLLEKVEDIRGKKLGTQNEIDLLHQMLEKTNEVMNNTKLSKLSSEEMVEHITFELDNIIKGFAGGAEEGHNILDGAKEMILERFKLRFGKHKNIYLEPTSDNINLLYARMYDYLLSGIRSHLEAGGANINPTYELIADLVGSHKLKEQFSEKNLLTEIAKQLDTEFSNMLEDFRAPLRNVKNENRQLARSGFVRESIIRKETGKYVHEHNATAQRYAWVAVGSSSGKGATRFANHRRDKHLKSLSQKITEGISEGFKSSTTPGPYVPYFNTREGAIVNKIGMAVGLKDPGTILYYTNYLGEKSDYNDYLLDYFENIIRYEFPEMNTTQRLAFKDIFEQINRIDEHTFKHITDIEEYKRRLKMLAVTVFRKEHPGGDFFKTKKFFTEIRPWNNIKNSLGKDHETLLPMLKKLFPNLDDDFNTIGRYVGRNTTRNAEIFEDIILNPNQYKELITETNLDEVFKFISKVGEEQKEQVIDVVVETLMEANEKLKAFVGLNVKTTDNGHIIRKIFKENNTYKMTQDLINSFFSVNDPSVFRYDLLTEFLNNNGDLRLVIEVPSEYGTGKLVWRQVDHKNEELLRKIIENREEFNLTVMSYDDFISLGRKIEPVELPPFLDKLHKNFIRPLKVLSLFNLPYLIVNYIDTPLKNFMRTKSLKTTITDYSMAASQFYKYKKAFLEVTLNEDMWMKYTNLKNIQKVWIDELDKNWAKYFPGKAKDIDTITSFRNIQEFTKLQGSAFEFSEFTRNVKASEKKIEQFDKLKEKVTKGKELTKDEQTKWFIINDKTNDYGKGMNIKTLQDEENYLKKLVESGNASYKEFQRYYHLAGKQDKRSLVKGFYKMFKFAGGQNFLNLVSDWETIGRLAMYNREIIEGARKSEAAQLLIKYHFAYSHKSQAEKMAEFVIPFITFPLRSAGFFYEALQDYETLKALTTFSKYSWGDRDYKDSDYLVNRKMRGDMLLNETTGISLGLPFYDALRTMGSPQEAFRNKLSPILKPAVDLLTDSKYNSITNLPGVSQARNIGRVYKGIQDGGLERNPIHTLFPSVTNEFYKQRTYNYNINRLYPRYRYNDLYTKSGYSRTQMRMQNTNTQNLPYRVNDIMYAFNKMWRR